MLAQLAAGMVHQLRNALTGARLSIQLHRKRCEYAWTNTSMTVAQRRFADRHPSRDAAAEAAEVWDRVNDLGPHDHTRSTRLSDLSEGTHHHVGAGGRYGSSRTGRKIRCVAR
jgi:hypothetical protein